jgi:hypothetical protein
MYAIVEDNNITQYVNNPKSVVIGDVRYPAKIFEIWSQSEKEAIGIYEIVSDKTNYKDPEYYMNTAPSYSFADGQVTESWGTATAKQLDDSFWTQSEIDALESAGDLEAGDLKSEGFKSNEMETQIDACTTVDELKTLYEYVNTGTEENPVIERPLAEFPEGI